MVQLNASTLPSVKMARGVAPKTERVIQFGEGGFLRAFCDWMIDMANEKAGMDAGVVIVQPIERGMVSMLNEQDGLYTLILRGQVDGKPSKDERIIQSVKRGLSPYEDFEGYLALAHNPDMRIIISYTTEAGIVYTGKDSFDDKPQASYPGKLTPFMRHFPRQRHMRLEKRSGKRRSREMCTHLWETLALARLFLHRESQTDLASQNLCRARLLRLYRYMKKEECRFIILMYTGSATSRRWTRSVMRITFTGKVCA